MASNSLNWIIIYFIENTYNVYSIYYVPMARRHIPPKYDFLDRWQQCFPPMAPFVCCSMDYHGYFVIPSSLFYFFSPTYQITTVPHNPHSMAHWPTLALHFYHGLFRFAFFRISDALLLSPYEFVSRMFGVFKS